MRTWTPKRLHLDLVPNLHLYNLNLLFVTKNLWFTGSLKRNTLYFIVHLTLTSRIHVLKHEAVSYSSQQMSILRRFIGGSQPERGMISKSAASTGTVKIRIVLVWKLPCFHPWIAITVEPGFKSLRRNALLRPNLMIAHYPPALSKYSARGAETTHRILLSTSICHWLAGTPRGSGYQNG